MAVQTQDQLYVGKRRQIRMGLFLQTAVIPDCTETMAREALERVARRQPSNECDMELHPDACRFAVHGTGVSILFEEDFAGFEDIAGTLSTETGRPVLLLYIYDGDFWGYFLCDKGEVVDAFSPMPDYFDEISEEMQEQMKGNAALIAQYFHVEVSSIDRYLIFWTEDVFEEEEKKAYEDDEFVIGEDWQMADFMRKLGYPYEW